MRNWFLVILMLIFGCRTKSEEHQEDLLDYNASRSSDLVIDISRSQGYGDVKIELGKLMTSITVHLDYIPQSHGNKASLPSCFSALSPLQVIGHISCENGLKVQLKMGNVEQRCTSSETTVEAKFPLAGLSQCTSGKLFLFGFSPILKVEVY